MFLDDVKSCEVFFFDNKYFIKALEQEPTRPHGKWVVGADMYYRCTNCNNGYKDVYGYNFCPNCGADMRETERKEE